jgi:disulfide bond formation protein DsbB
MKRYSFYLAWLIATIASLASLYYSEILALTPCRLCWFQRVFLFPLPILLFPLIFKQKREFIPYVLPLPILGLATALYQQIARPPCCFSDPIRPIFGILTFLLITTLLIFSLPKK